MADDLPEVDVGVFTITRLNFIIVNDIQKVTTIKIAFTTELPEVDTIHESSKWNQ